MKRLLNIDRPGGFPLCAETLGVLNENSMMLLALLAEIPLERMQAVRFGQYMLVCDNSQQKRVVKVGATSPFSQKRCNLEFHASNHSVYDSGGNEIANVWSSETADINEVTNPYSIWSILTLGDLFAPDPWQDRWQEFEAGLPGISLTNAGQLELNPVLQGSSNFFRSNRERMQMRFNLLCRIKVSEYVAMDFPLPVVCQDGACIMVQVNSITNQQITSSCTVPAHTLNNKLRVEIGRGLADYGFIQANTTCTRDVLIRVNGEVLL